MVTSTSTPGSMLMDVICFTISDGLWRSMILLWILIWKRSHVFEPSPQGVFLVVILMVLVGMRTGPFTFKFLSFAPRIRSEHTENQITTAYVNKSYSLFFIHDNYYKYIFWSEVALASQCNAAIITFFQALHIEACQSDSDPMNRNFFLNLAFFKRSSCLYNTMSTSYCYDHISLKWITTQWKCFYWP